MSHPLIDAFEKSQMKTGVPRIRVGDTLQFVRLVIEGKKKRNQSIQGTVIKIQNGLSRRTFTVRRSVGGVSLEQSFLVHSPLISDIVILKRAKVRRARLYYLRNRIGAKANRLKAVDN